LTLAKQSQADHPTRLVSRVGSALNEAYRNWSRHRTIRLGAGLAYYGLFALVPMVSLIFFVAGTLFSSDSAQSFVSNHLSDTSNANLDAAAASIAAELGNGSTQATLGVLGLVGLMIAASLVFVAVEDALGIIFEQPPGRGTENWLRRRALAFGTVLLATTIFVVALALQAITGLLESLVDADGTIINEIADLLGLVFSAGLLTITLTLPLRLMTSPKVPWHYALVGSAVTALGLAVGGWGLGVYFSTVGAASLAGAIGGVLALLFFMYYEAEILLAGAELTNVIWRRGTLPVDQDDGVRTTTEGEPTRWEK
jgi:membrane protein